MTDYIFFAKKGATSVIKRFQCSLYYLDIGGVLYQSFFDQPSGQKVSVSRVITALGFVA